MRAVVGGKLDDRATRHTLRKLQNVANRRPAKSVQALIFVADHAQIASPLGQFQQQLFLDVVRVLVFIHEHMADFPRHSVGGFRIGEKGDHGPLQMSKVDPVRFLKGVFIAQVGLADLFQKGFGGIYQLRRIDQFLGDLAEIVSRAFDRRPARCPAAQIESLGLRADDFVELLEDEKELRQIIQGLESMSERRPVPVLGKNAIAETVDCGNRQFRQVAGIADLSGGGSQSVPHLERGLLREGAHHDLLGRGFFLHQQIQGPQNDAVGFA